MTNLVRSGESRSPGSLTEEATRHAVDIVREGGWTSTPGFLTIMGAVLAIAAVLIGHNIRVTMAIILVTAVVVTLTTASMAMGRAIRGPADRMRVTAHQRETARDKASTWLDEMITDKDPRWLETFRGINAIMKDEAATAIGDDLAIRMRDLHAAWTQARADNGRADATSINLAARDAAVALALAAIEAHAELDARITAGDSVHAPDVARRFAQTARAVAGIPSLPGALPPPSASASLQRLIGLAENALEVDPDLVDDTGARLDDLVRRHLPRLLERHASAARAQGPVDLAGVDAELAAGVEQVRASVEEALERDARNRFDALRTDVAFLRARRGGK